MSVTLSPYRPNFAFPVKFYYWFIISYFTEACWVISMIRICFNGDTGRHHHPFRRPFLHLVKKHLITDIKLMCRIKAVLRVIFIRSSILTSSVCCVTSQGKKRKIIQVLSHAISRKVTQNVWDRWGIIHKFIT